MNKFFYNVAIAVPLRQTFTYHSNQEIIPGTRVAVKFGKTNKNIAKVMSLNKFINEALFFIYKKETLFAYF